MQEQTQNAPKVAKRPPAPQDGRNYWFDGDVWKPVDELSVAHLRRAKLYAQRKAEIFWRKSSEFQELVEMLEAEAERRGVTLRDLRSKFSKSTRVLKNACKHAEEKF